MGSGFEPQAPHQAKRDLLIFVRRTIESSHETTFSAAPAGEAFDHAESPAGLSHRRTAEYERYVTPGFAWGQASQNGQFGALRIRQGTGQLADVTNPSWRSGFPTS